MDLFSDYNTNLLPYDGTVLYFGPVLGAEQALQYYEKLLHDMPWQHDEAIIYGKRIITKRKVAWYGDKNFAYTYSNTTKYALPWTTELLELKQLTEQVSGHKFNSCLLNLYPTGQEGMSWHSDDEPELGPQPVIASISLGAARDFRLRRKDRSTAPFNLRLAHGSLLCMGGDTQAHWQHSLPRRTRVTTPRINLTFRRVLAQPATKVA